MVTATHRFAFAAFGVGIAVDVEHDGDDGFRAAVESILPPGRTDQDDDAPVVARLRIARVSGQVRVDSGTTSETYRDDSDAIHALDRDLRSVVSLAAPEHVFVHAGVVAGPAGALVVPGRSFAGKTTLVGALVAAGAEYLSDEYAVLDRTGAVHPYPRPLSLRTPSGRSDISPHDLGRVAPDRQHPVAVVLTASYRPGAVWAPEPGGPADCALALIDNAVAARVRSGEVMTTTARVARSATYLRTERGETEAAVPDLLRLIGCSPHPATAVQRPLAASTPTWRHHP